jgi:uroporphyrinogen III methyltransferase/synthase
MTPAGDALPLAGKRVVVTRATEQAQDLTDKLRALGAEVIECPAISIAPLEDFTELDRALERLSDYDWVVFTSANGVRAVLDRLEQPGRNAEDLRGRKLAAIGPATAAALERAGCEPDFMPDTYVAEAIVEQIGDVRGLRILLPRADIARKTLAEGLRSGGAHVDEVTAYRTVPGEGSIEMARSLQAGGVDAVTFTSSSTVRYTLEGLESTGLGEERAVELLNRAGIVCIGPVTAETARQHGLEVASTAQEYTIDGLVDALRRLLMVDG